MPQVQVSDGDCGDNSVKFWDAVSWMYDGVADRPIGRQLRKFTRAWLSREKNLGKAVEFGCGTGYFTEALAGVAGSVMATDFSGRMLALAEWRLKDIKNIIIKNEDCRNTSFRHETFDTVFMAQVLNVTDDPAGVLREAHRILRPGGTVIIASPDWSSAFGFFHNRSIARFMMAWGEPLYLFPQEFNFYLSMTVLEAMLEKAGFRVLSVSRIMDEPLGCRMLYIRAIKLAGNAIEVEHLRKWYGNLSAVDDVSFCVRRGEVFALLGPNGAGKTTIVEILEGILGADGGMVNVLGTAGAMADKAHAAHQADKDYVTVKERIGVLPQNFSAFDRLTVRENVDYIARMHSRWVDIDRLIAGFRLEDRKNALFGSLSGGEKRRVGIVMALVNDPDVVYLDEPTKGLDPWARRDVWKEIRSLKARGKTVFITTHYMDEAYQHADRVCVLNRGKVVAEGSPEEVTRKYGGDNTLIIRECSAEALGRLAREMPESRIEGSNMLARVPEGDGTASIEKAVSILRAGNHMCKEVFIRRPTLDDVFINLTGERIIEGGQ